MGYGENNRPIWQENSRAGTVWTYLSVTRVYGGKGIGTKTVRAMADYLMKAHDAKCVCADPEKSNNRSVRCWIKAGFSAAGEIQNRDFPDKTNIMIVVFR